jgi:hypothetical protein
MAHYQKEKKMENYIICPNCKTTITDTKLINEAANSEGAFTQFMRCECGERITYWQITAQLKEQRTIGRRFKNWIRSFSHTQS